MYMYCIKLHRSEEEFWCSTIAKITTMIDIYADEQRMKNAQIQNEYYESKYFSINKNEDNVITSMSQIG